MSIQKQHDFDNANKDVERYHNMEKKNKQAKFERNKNHLVEVVQQMQLKPNMFAKTGVAIVRNGNRAQSEGPGTQERKDGRSIPQSPSLLNGPI